MAHDRSLLVDLIAEDLPELERLALRAALLAQKAGFLDEAAELTAKAVRSRRSVLEWPALLLALNSAELRLGGAVRYETPARTLATLASPGPRYAPEDVVWRWDPFVATTFTFTGEHMVMLTLTRRTYGDFHLTPPRESVSRECAEAAEALAESVTSHLYAAVTF